MVNRRLLKAVIAGVLVTVPVIAGQASAAECGNTAAGFSTWKQQFAEEARSKGISAPTISAMMQTNYATATIQADRSQGSFRLSLDQFLARRGGSGIVARGRALKQSQ